MTRIAILFASLLLCACTPLVTQQAGQPPLGFQGPRMTADHFVTFDGTRLGLTTWEARTEEPWAVIVAVHGMNDYANAFHLAAPYWAEQGVTTYAYDQRGFGRSPERGLWPQEELLLEDLRTLVALVRQKHPHALVAVAGESMGGAVAIRAFASQRPPQAHRLILMSPAVWGWSTQPLPYKTLLWFAAHMTGPKVYTPPEWVTDRVKPTDNIEELRAMGRDPLMIWGARSDTLYGLVDLMEGAWRDIGRLQVPTLYLYGANDEIIPARPAFQAAAKLKPEDRSAYYEKGWHLLTRDLQGRAVMGDVLAFVKDPQAPLPSGAPPIPTAPQGDDWTPAPDRATAGL
ncbi:MAG: alpha/beta hydrolase [Phenylobacterium sp.]|uniref:alpha/beta hydrolase n=1 Tax=Phenylobacterium sp. TaxID=1871053 RepID=UPI0017CC4563|nr:alpha/beta hydrolase [Phenylobacterium sp.]MBA4793946.1 alpha/beta hydrolase [Phenylobacterium sp.]